MTSMAPLEQARAAYEEQAWSAARSTYAELGPDAPLTLDDFERYAIAAHLLGDEMESREVLARGYREALRLEDVSRASRFAIWIAHSMIFSEEIGQTRGWIGRARNLLSERGADCVEWGYLMIVPGVEQLLGGDASAACDTFTEALSIGRRFADASLVAMAGHGRGRALIRLGAIEEGMAALDEVMVAVATGEVSPLIVGEAYCGVLEACHEVFDVRRAREWTAVLTRWCEGQPDLVAYRGPCLVHRVELMRMRGDWDDAIEDARRACDWLSDPATPEGPADAFYQLAELYRLRGDVEGAEEAYRQASRLGRAPEPGLALLWLMRGQVEDAAAAIRRALDEGGDEDRTKRAELLAAHVEIMLARGDMSSAQESAGALARLGTTLNALPVLAMADQAEGSVRLEAGDPRGALTVLRRAWAAWRQLDAPYDAARVRVLIGKACEALGDTASAAMEFDAARWVFEGLGAAPDIARLEVESPSHSGVTAAAGLTQRELDVLCLIAAGETNKEIAAALVISEHTVARHVQNMLQKLGFSSRASLAAFAVEKGLTRGL